LVTGAGYDTHVVVKKVESLLANGLQFPQRHHADNLVHLANKLDRIAGLGTTLLPAPTILLRDGTRIWIITEADRSATTILLPSEY
jgi:hypothetical protein